ncbi:MAG: phosphopentomutase [Deltaproteobacteria bacterium]|nr:phosphopentomutase [Deltaproteobacteria bacterium]
MSRGTSILVVLDSVGAGALPDAGRYGDAGADTLGHVLETHPDLALPNLRKMGLGNALALLRPRALKPVDAPLASFGLAAEKSPGKDTTTGHWEMAGVVLDRPFTTFHDGFPPAFIDRFVAETGRGALGNKAASGTAIIDELGPEQQKTGKWIVYTSADSVFQVAAHERVIPLDELYRACEKARAMLDSHFVGRVIARPYVGEPANYKRTYNRKDFSMLPQGETLLDRLSAHGIETVGVGKIHDIFAGKGVARSIHTEGNADGIRVTIEEIRRLAPHASILSPFLFVNLIDFDMTWGHRRDAGGYAAGLKAFDVRLPEIIGAMGPDDLLMITADHGCDPTFSAHTDHTREHVPLLAYTPKGKGANLGIRPTFADIGATIAEFYGVGPLAHGTSFLREVL